MENVRKKNNQQPNELKIEKQVSNSSCSSNIVKIQQHQPKKMHKIRVATVQKVKNTINIFFVALGSCCFHGRKFLQDHRKHNHTLCVTHVGSTYFIHEKFLSPHYRAYLITYTYMCTRDSRECGL